MKKMLAVVGALLFVLACHNPLAVESDLLVARVTAKHLELVNTGSQPVYYFAVDKNSLTYIRWAPCLEPQTCQGVQQRSTLRIPLSEVALYGKGDTEIVIYHWRLVPGESHTGYVTDSMRTITLPVK